MILNINRVAQWEEAVETGPGPSRGPPRGAAISGGQAGLGSGKGGKADTLFLCGGGTQPAAPWGPQRAKENR